MITQPGTLILRTARLQAMISGWNPNIWSEDDYSVVDGDTVVGCIYPEEVCGEMRWLWFLQTVPARPPNRGIVGSLEEAKTAFKARYAEVGT